MSNGDSDGLYQPPFVMGNILVVRCTTPEEDSFDENNSPNEVPQDNTVSQDGISLTSEEPITEAMASVSLEEPILKLVADEEIFPIPPDDEIVKFTGTTSPRESVPEGATTHPMNPVPNFLPPVHLKDFLVNLQTKYPVSSFFTDSSPLNVRRGRAFSISELEERDDWADQNYRETFPGCVPIPAGMWEELGRVDALQMPGILSSK